MKKAMIFILLFISFLTTVVEANSIFATGYSAPGQSKYAAIRAAKVDAQRKLLEKIYEVRINTKNSLPMNKKDIYSVVEGTLKGAQVISKKYDCVSGTAEVTLKLEMGRVSKAVKKSKKE